MNPRDKMTLNPAPIRNPGKPLKYQTMPQSACGFKRAERLKELRFDRKFRKAAKRQLNTLPTTGQLHRERRLARATLA